MSRFWLNGYFNFVKNLEEGRRLFIRNVRKLGHKWVLFDPGEDERIFKGGVKLTHWVSVCVHQKREVRELRRGRRGLGKISFTF